MRRYRDIIIDTAALANMNTPITDITLDIGYSLHFLVTGSLQFTCEIYAGNVNDPTKLTVLSGSAQVINNIGFVYNQSFAQYDYFYIKISAVSGAGTVQCIRTVKEI